MRYSTGWLPVPRSGRHDRSAAQNSVACGGRPGLAGCSCDLSTLVHCVGQGYEAATGIEPAVERLGLLSLRGCPGEWDADAGGCGETLRPLVVFFACLLDECVDRLQTGAGGTDSR